MDEQSMNFMCQVENGQVVISWPKVMKTISETNSNLTVVGSLSSSAATPEDHDAPEDNIASNVIQAQNEIAVDQISDTHGNGECVPSGNSEIANGVDTDLLSLVDLARQRVQNQGEGDFAISENVAADDQFIFIDDDAPAPRVAENPLHTGPIDSPVDRLSTDHCDQFDGFGEDDSGPDTDLYGTEIRDYIFRYDQMGQVGILLPRPSKQSELWIHRNDMPIPPPNRNYVSILDDGSNEMRWSTRPPTKLELDAKSKLTITSPNFIQLSPKASELKKCNSPLEFFRMIVTEDVIKSIVQIVNKFADAVKRKSNARSEATDRAGSSSQPSALTFDDTDLWAFFGVYLLLCEQGMQNLSVHDLYGMDMGYMLPFVLRSFNKNRFAILRHNLHFDTKLFGKSGLKPVLRILKIFFDIVHNGSNLFLPGYFVTLKEAKMDTNGSVFLDTKSPYTRTTRAMKLCYLIDSRTGILLKILPLPSKDPNHSDHLNSASSAILLKLVKKLENTGRVVVANSEFISIELALELRKRGLQILGPIDEHSPGIPVALKLLNFREYFGGSAKCSQNSHNQDQDDDDCVEILYDGTANGTHRRAGSSDEVRERNRNSSKQQTFGQQSTLECSDSSSSSYNAFLFSDFVTLCKRVANDDGPSGYFLSTANHAPEVSVNGQPKMLKIWDLVKPGIGGENCSSLFNVCANSNSGTHLWLWLVETVAETAYKAFIIANQGSEEATMTRSDFIRNLATALMEPQWRRQESVEPQPPWLKAVLDLINALEEYRELDTDESSLPRHSAHRTKGSALESASVTRNVTAHSLASQRSSTQVSRTFTATSVDFGYFRKSTERRRVQIVQKAKLAVKQRRYRGRCYGASCRKKHSAASRVCALCDKWVCFRHGAATCDDRGKVVSVVCRKDNPESYCTGEPVSRKKIKLCIADDD